MIGVILVRMSLFTLIILQYAYYGGPYGGLLTIGCTKMTKENNRFA